MSNVIIDEQHGFVQGRSTTTNFGISTNFLPFELGKAEQVNTLSFTI